ncbi:ABC transporter substrate-binding protein [soil metagenome]
MSNHISKKRRGFIAAVSIGALAAFVLSACSTGATSNATSANASHLPSTIKLVGIRDQTGVVSYTGVSAAKGTALAIKEINDTAFLGDGVSVAVDELDSAFDPQVAAAAATSALAAGGVTALLGPQISSEALAVAPIATAAQVPIVFTQSGVDGLLSGDFTFRASASQASIWPAATDHLIKSGAKTVSIFSSATNPTYHDLGTKVIPGLLDKGNVKTVSSFDLETSVTDFQAPVGRVVADKPDAVVVTLIGPQITTLVVQLRQAGYKGEIYVVNALVTKQFESMGADGVGLIFPATFSPANDADYSATFTKAFNAQFGVEPDAYAAEAYDQTWWVAKAIKLAGSADPVAVATALAEVGAQGFTGAQGPITFENNDDARAKGVLVTWDGSKQVIVK